MRLGAVNFINNKFKEEENLSKNIWVAIGTSTTFTIIIVIL